MEIKVPKEVRQYHESIFFGLSLRQFGCSLAAVGAAVGIVLLMCGYAWNGSDGLGMYPGGRAAGAGRIFYLQRDAAGKIFVGGIQKPGAARPAPRVPGKKLLVYILFVKRAAGKPAALFKYKRKEGKRRMKQKWKRYSASFLCAAAVCDAVCVHGVRRGRRAGRGPKRHAIYLRDRVHVFRQLPDRQHTGDLHITQQL